MANVPTKKVITNVDSTLINAITAQSSPEYRNYVPFVTGEAETLRDMGTVLMDNPALRNEFLNNLVNKIMATTITSRTYDNPLAVFKKGKLEAGETVEEIFNGLVKANEYDIDTAENELFKRVKPDVKSAFHPVNYQKFYKLTIEDETLSKAFRSYGAMNSFVMNLIERIYTSANYDEYQVFKLLLFALSWGGSTISPDPTTATVDIGTEASVTTKKIVTAIKATSNDLTFMSNNYTLAGVTTHTPKSEQYIILNSELDAEIDVDLLASAFHMDRAQFEGHKIVIDKWDNTDTERLYQLIAEGDNPKMSVMFESETDTSIHTFDHDFLAAANKTKALIVDRNFFQIYDRLLTMRNAENGQGLYKNYFYHVWKTISVSPFSNVAVLKTH